MFIMNQKKLEFQNYDVLFKISNKRNYFQGLDCCSDYAITFHDTSPNQMYILDYLIYHLKPYGIAAIPPPLIAKISETEMHARFGGNSSS